MSSPNGADGWGGAPTSYVNVVKIGGSKPAATNRHQTHAGQPQSRPTTRRDERPATHSTPQREHQQMARHDQQPWKPGNARPAAGAPRSPRTQRKPQGAHAGGSRDMPAGDGQPKIKIVPNDVFSSSAAKAQQQNQNPVTVSLVPNPVFEDSKNKSAAQKNTRGILKNASPTPVVQSSPAGHGKRAQAAQQAALRPKKRQGGSGMKVATRMSTFFGISDPSGGLWGDQMRPSQNRERKKADDDGVPVDKVPRTFLKKENSRSKVKDADLIKNYDRGMAAYNAFIKREKAHAKKSRPRQSFGDALLGATMNPRRNSTSTLGRHVGKDSLQQISERTMIREELMSLPEFKPIFIRSISLVQFLILAAMILLSLMEEEFGKFGLSNVGEECSVSDGTCPVTFDGTYEVGAESIEPFNPWMGPNTNFLIQFNAKYSPCMREDTGIQKKLRLQRQDECGSITETSTGLPVFNEKCVEEFEGYSCCMLMPGQAADIVQRGALRVDRILSSNYSALRTSGTTYGMMTLTECQSYESAGALWLQDGTGFPQGTNANVLCNPPGLASTDAVPVALRPCCVGIKGTCILLTKSQCNFRAGIFHESFQLCSDVSCLEETCTTKVGGAPDVKPHPYDNELEDINQWQRFIAPLFLSSGAIHFFITVVAQLYLGTPIERSIGFLRMMLIYFISGVGGYLMSGIFDPYVVSVGANPAIFGLLGVVVVELLQTWKVVPNPGWKLTKILTVILIAIVIGSFPFIDNMAQTGGLFFGMLAACIFLPYISLGKWNARGRKIILWIAAPLLLFGILITVIMFYVVQNTEWCTWCATVSCWEWDPALSCDGGGDY